MIFHIIDLIDTSKLSNAKYEYKTELLSPYKELWCFKKPIYFKKMLNAINAILQILTLFLVYILHVHVVVATHIGLVFLVVLQQPIGRNEIM